MLPGMGCICCILGAVESVTYTFQMGLDGSNPALSAKFLNQDRIRQTHWNRWPHQRRTGRSPQSTAFQDLRVVIAIPGPGYRGLVGRIPIRKAARTEIPFSGRALRGTLARKTYQVCPPATPCSSTASFQTKKDLRIIRLRQASQSLNILPDSCRVVPPGAEDIWTSDFPPGVAHFGLRLINYPTPAIFRRAPLSRHPSAAKAAGL